MRPSPALDTGNERGYNIAIKQQRIEFSNLNLYTNSPKVMSVYGVSVFETAKLVAQRALKKGRVETLTGATAQRL
jgi:hypothetical protein